MPAERAKVGSKPGQAPTVGGANSPSGRPSDTPHPLSTSPPGSRCRSSLRLTDSLGEAIRIVVKLSVCSTVGKTGKLADREAAIVSACRRRRPAMGIRML